MLTAISWAIDSLLDISFFAKTTIPPTAEETAELTKLANRWKAHLSAGRFKLSVPLDTPLGDAQGEEIGGFWTTQYSYQDIAVVAPKLLEELQKSQLVLFKGDLNYRK